MPKGRSRDPGNCMLAHCAARDLGARTVAFFRGITYLDRIGPDGERRIERYMNSAAARRLIVAFDSGTQPITTDTTLTQARAFTQIRPDTGWPCSDRIEPRPHRREECERQRGTNPETFGKPARGRQWLGTSPATDRALGKKPDASRRTARRGSRAAKCAEQAVAETKKLQGVTTRPQRHLDLTTRSGAEGRYVFDSAPDGSNQ